MRYWLAFFFFMMYAGQNAGLNVSLGPGLSSKNLLLYLVFAGIALETAVARNRSFELPSVLITFALLIVYAVTSWIVVGFIFPSPDYDPQHVFIKLKSSLVDQLLTFMIFFFGIIHAKDAFWLLRTILWITIIGNIVTLIDTFNIPDLGIFENAARKGGRFDGFIGQPNAYGQILVLFLAPAIALYANESGKRRAIVAIGVFAAAMALVLTGSRGSWVGLLVGSALAAFYLRRSIPAQVMVKAGVIAILVCLVIVVITFITGYADPYIGSIEKFEGGADRATSGRVTLWTIAIFAMLDQPISFIIGNGFDAYDNSRQFFKAVHNVYLSYLYDMGLIGLALFVAVFSRILVTARSVIDKASEDSRRYFIALVFGLFAFLVAIFFSEYHTAAYLLWAYLGVMMRLAMIVKSDVEKNAGENDMPKQQPKSEKPKLGIIKSSGPILRGAKMLK